jgi:hypothetical protein
MVKWDSLYNHLIESKQSAVGELRMKTSTPMKHGNYKGCYFRRKK